MKILTIVGARPQFIKAAAVSSEFAKHDDIEEIVVHTGQHFDTNMSDIFFEQMNIPGPKYQLNINSLSHGAMTGRMLEKIEEVILEEKPDYILVYGDTNSTLAGALAAKKLHVKVAHVEAGLRSFNMDMPEEINRILTDRISDILFCPTDVAIENLKKEGFDKFQAKVVKSGDVMQDAAMLFEQYAQKPKFNLPDKYILATVHRAENTNDPQRLKNIFDAFEEISAEIPVVLPLHPRTKKIINKLGINPQKTIIFEPVGYLEMVWLIKNSQLIVTDSGGLQKEAFFFGKFCVTLRDETEWTELVDNGFNILTGADKNKIILAIKASLGKHGDFSINLYGHGLASKIIAEELKK